MASLNEQTVFSKGIFHGLPTFPDAAGKKYSAIVAGANGITGSYIVRALAEAPDRWGTIYALSRRPPRDHIADNVKHLSVDFLSPPEDMARELKEHVSKVYVNKPSPNHFSSVAFSNLCLQFQSSCSTLTLVRYIGTLHSLLPIYKFLPRKVRVSGQTRKK